MSDKSSSSKKSNSGFKSLRKNVGMIKEVLYYYMMKAIYYLYMPLIIYLGNLINLIESYLLGVRTIPFREIITAMRQGAAQATSM